MSFQLHEQPDKTFVVKTDGKSMTCPLKTSFAQAFKHPITQEAVQGFVGQACQSNCLLFEMIEENTARLHCGKRDINITEKIMLPLPDESKVE